ncbi:hypothetical protein DEU56DRAFT_809977 [Suillus clintonianus]|uniref:uncharacterized protein n=1 Tax=Suillus clintonianus TaxID=1904413 RepID=UPI001B8815E0|nr:uncharacterized protein DEU56DRAFT_809977 [Suillus clintonianus]KAG2134103.1 hypothetical protein DEU56DRAFT_809977 [Suillus clintonianus]
MSSGVSKITTERNQRTLLELATQPGNDTCADCKSRNPRWASHNLGIFICVNCASIHRKLGTHITKVKSITLDAWTKEQVEVMKRNGNITSNALYNPDEARHPPPTNMMEAERDSEIEKFIRAKYEFKWFMNCKPSKFVPPARPSSNAVNIRPKSTPATDPVPFKRKSSPVPPPVPAKNVTHGGPGAFNFLPGASSLGSTPVQPARSISQPLSTPNSSIPIQKPPGNQVWDDLISLQDPSHMSSLPLQYQLQNSGFPSLPSQPHAMPLAQTPLDGLPTPFSTFQGSHMMPSSMPSMRNTTSATVPTHIGAASATSLASPQTPFQHQFSGYSSSNTLNSFPPQMSAGTPAATPLSQQNYFAQSFAQPSQPVLGHMQDPSFMYAQMQSQAIQQQYSPQPPFAATPGFVAQQQQPPFMSNGAYGGWQGMHGNF